MCVLFVVLGFMFLVLRIVFPYCPCWCVYLLLCLASVCVLCLCFLPCCILVGVVVHCVRRSACVMCVFAVVKFSVDCSSIDQQCFVFVVFMVVVPSVSCFLLYVFLCSSLCVFPLFVVFMCVVLLFVVFVVDAVPGYSVYVSFAGDILRLWLRCACLSVCSLLCVLF